MTDTNWEELVDPDDVAVRLVEVRDQIISLRESLHEVSQMVFLMKRYSEAEHMNLGSGTDIRVDDLAAMVMDVVGLKGDLRKDTSKSDGTPKKLMGNSRIKALGWSPKIPLREGVEAVYRDAPFR